MGSSLGLVFKSLVMLTCLAVVPLVAMYGKYVPDFAQAVIETYKARTQAKGAPDPAAAAGGEAPPFAGASPQSDVGLSPRYGGEAAVPRGSPANAATPRPWTDAGQPARPLSDWQQPSGSDSLSAPNDLQRASFTAPVGGPAAGGPTVLGRMAGGGDSSQGNNAPLSPPANGVAAAPPRNGDSTGPTDASNCTAQFRRMEQRLRDLGATYYLLETFGSSGDQYRFFCKMAIAGSGENNDNRKFQATAADPLRAMQNVLDQVEQWHAGRQP